MFYENDRIVRKQARFVYGKAVDMIDNFKSKGLETDEIIAALELLLHDENSTEIHQDIVARAIHMLKRGK